MTPNSSFSFRCGKIDFSKNNLPYLVQHLGYLLSQDSPVPTVHLLLRENDIGFLEAERAYELLRNLSFYQDPFDIFLTELKKRS
jgi:hypothetical protein